MSERCAYCKQPKSDEEHRPGNLGHTFVPQAPQAESDLEVQDCATPLSDGELQRIFAEHDEHPHLTRMDEFTCFKCRARATIGSLFSALSSLRTENAELKNKIAEIQKLADPLEHAECLVCFHTHNELRRILERGETT